MSNKIQHKELVGLAKEMNDLMGLTDKIDVDQDDKGLITAIKSNLEFIEPEDFSKEDESDEAFSDKAQETLKALGFEVPSGKEEEETETEEVTKMSKKNKKVDAEEEEEEVVDKEEETDEEEENDEAEENDAEEDAEETEEEEDDKPAKKSKKVSKDDDKDEESEEEEPSKKSKKVAAKDEEEDDDEEDEKPAKKAKAVKKEASYSRYGHLSSTMGGIIDEMVHDGTTEKEMVSRITKEFGRNKEEALNKIKTHVKHLINKCGVKVKYDEGKKAYSSVTKHSTDWR